jgi:hypothetical protein
MALLPDSQDEAVFDGWPGEWEGDEEEEKAGTKDTGPGPKAGSQPGPLNRELWWRLLCVHRRTRNSAPALADAAERACVARYLADSRALACEVRQEAADAGRSAARCGEHVFRPDELWDGFVLRRAGVLCRQLAAPDAECPALVVRAWTSPVHFYSARYDAGDPGVCGIFSEAVCARTRRVQRVAHLCQMWRAEAEGARETLEVAVLRLDDALSRRGTPLCGPSCRTWYACVPHWPEQAGSRAGGGPSPAQRCCQLDLFSHSPDSKRAFHAAHDVASPPVLCFNASAPPRLDLPAATTTN